ncbi:hypothetical protein FSPOR_11845 [Fusarium sporotrichioides]|uniref:CBM-cenC domain-containing protein n=1 Tax=Fusarium sporotrichioides TaxID=5514 RepID=A0A395RF92_FUSSP|nr:hypothetical protein FSPOR_11845 [Fusarium sporotrichioides]
MRLVSFITVLGAALIPAASARPANCRPQRPTTTSRAYTLMTTSTLGVETSSADGVPTTLATSSETTNVIETTNTESATATSDLSRAIDTIIAESVTKISSLATAAEATISQSASDTTTLITAATTTTETNPAEMSTTESTSTDQVSFSGAISITATNFETTTADTTTIPGTTTDKQTTVQTTTAAITTTAEMTTTTEIPKATTVAPEPTMALQNGDFEDATNHDWAVFSGEIVNNPGHARSGSNFAKIDIQNEQAGGQQHVEQITSTSNTKQYTLSFYATILSTPNMKPGTGCYVLPQQDNSSFNGQTLPLSADSLNSYQHFTYNFTPFNNNFLLQLRVRCNRGPATTFSVAVDDVTIFEVV